MEPIKIFKGNDTNFNDGKFLTFTVTGDIDLSDFSGVFTLGSFSKPGSLADGKMEVVIPAAVTAQFPLGSMCGTFQLVDNKMRVATVTNTIPFLVTNEVFTPTPAVVELETPEGYPVDLSVDVYFAGGNYNDLNNLPQINGVTLTGNKTSAELGLAGQDELTAHVNNQSNPHNVTKSQVGLGNVDNTSDLDKPISTATQTALNSKQDALNATQLQAVNSGINTAGVAQIGTNTSGISGINSKIPTQASESNQLADKDFVNSSINAMAAFYVTSDVAGDPFATRAALIAGPWYFKGELRTPTQNDYALVTSDETHDNKTSRYMYDGTQWVWQYDLNNTEFTAAQIAAINSGITAAGVAQIGENTTKLQRAWTMNNLVSGNNISITQVHRPTVSEDECLALVHFDGTIENEISDKAQISVPNAGYSGNLQYSTDYAKFGQSLRVFSPGTGDSSNMRNFLHCTFDPVTGPFHFEVWYYLNVPYEIGLWFATTGQQFFPNSNFQLNRNGNSLNIRIITNGYGTQIATIPNDSLAHFAIERDANNNMLMYINGQCVIGANMGYSNNISFDVVDLHFRSQSYDMNLYVDEVLILNTIKYNGSSYELNNEPYILGELPTQYAINNIQDISGKQDVISDLATIRAGAAAGATALQPATAASTYVPLTQKAAANGVATLDNTGKITAGQIPYATSARVGGIKQSFDATTGTWTVITEEA